MSLKTRLTKIETQTAPQTAWGFQLDDGPVTVMGGEEMTREAFEKRYPAGDLIRFRLINGHRSPRPGAGRPRQPIDLKT